MNDTPSHYHLYLLYDAGLQLHGHMTVGSHLGPDEPLRSGKTARELSFPGVPFSDETFTYATTFDHKPDDDEVDAHRAVPRECDEPHTDVSMTVDESNEMKITTKNV
jgi:hypothetical protein